MPRRNREGAPRDLPHAVIQGPYSGKDLDALGVLDQLFVGWVRWRKNPIETHLMRLPTEAVLYMVTRRWTLDRKRLSTIWPTFCFSPADGSIRFFGVTRGGLRELQVYRREVSSGID